LGQPLTHTAKAALDRAILATYRQAGITTSPHTWNHRPPLLSDLAATLAEDTDPHAKDLAAGLAPYVSGSHRQLFDGPTTTAPAPPCRSSPSAPCPPTSGGWAPCCPWTPSGAASPPPTTSVPAWSWWTRPGC